ncbi:MAG: ABC transporter ATP-binding protein [Bacillota bacterium]|nr:ABC transporter ATP-binding protein [Bacillota bacterium]
MAVLEVTNLQVNLDSRVIIDNLTFSVESSETLSVLGPNGVGKTTLVRAITGLLPFEGQVKFFGRDLKSYSRKQLAQKVAVMNQRQEITPGFKVKDAVSLGRIPHITRRETKKDFEVVKEALRLAELEALQDKTLDTISGGELARVGLARALAQEPEFLILDEPTAHLDVGYIADLTELLFKIKQEKQLSLLLILHDISLASALSDRLLFFGDDKFYLGDVDEVLTENVLESVYGVENIVGVNPLNGKKSVWWNYKGQ